MATKKTTKKKSQWTWAYAPEKVSAAKMSPILKAQIEAKAVEFIENYLKPTHVKPPPEDPQFNYVIDIWYKWHGSNFYFGATYACPSPYAMSPTFESRFARLTFIGNEQFNLAAQRHTGAWMELYQNRTFDLCLAAIRADPWFATP